MIDYDAYDVELELVQRERRAHRRATFVPNRPPKRRPSEVIASLADTTETEDGLALSYNATRHERVWIVDALGTFFAQGMITDVLRLAKGGKEANVYVCAANPGLGVAHVAAKIYRPRRFRNLRNDALYRNGRKALNADGKLVKDSRALHAMQRGTGKGKEMAHTSWLAHEFVTLRQLFDAGVDVPRPIIAGDNVILMDYLGDASQPAPTLNHVTLAPEAAGPLFQRTLRNVERMLAQRRVHGDLSAYNILYWQGEITVIDFPQAVDPFENPAARRIFDRDVARVCAYFAEYGLESDPPALAESIWRRHVPDGLWDQLPPVPEEL